MVSKDFEKLRSEMDAYDKAREHIIINSRAITKESKAAIYALQRDEDEEAAAHLKVARAAIDSLLPAIKKDPTLRTGGFSGGVEEYVEAIAFQHFLHEGKLLSRTAVPFADAEEYLGGLCDLTGELNRYGVLRATKGDGESVQRIRNVIDEIYGALSTFDLRNGDLRRKYDAVKYALQKIEQVLYDLSLRPKVQ